MRGHEQRDYLRDMRGHEQRDYLRDMRGHEQRDDGRDMRDREQRDYRRDTRGRDQRDYGRDTSRRSGDARDQRADDRGARDRRRYADEPGRDLGSFEGDHGRWSRREYDIDNRDVRADDSHELRRDRGEWWHGSETRGSDEYGRGLEQRTPEDRFRPENREWAARISSGDRGRRH
jgi:hypothetical protein